MRTYKQNQSTSVKNETNATPTRLDNTNQTVLSTEFCIYVHGILIASLFILAILR